MNSLSSTKRSSSSSSSSSPTNSPPRSPRGLKRTNDGEISQSRTKQPKVEGTGHGAPATTSSSPAEFNAGKLWETMPAELVQKIAWAYEPVRLTFTPQERVESDQTVRINGQALFHLAITNRQTFRLLRPLLHSARLSVALAQISGVYISTMPVHALLPDPTAAPDIYTGPAFMPPKHQNMTYKQLHERQLDTLLQVVLETSEPFTDDEPVGLLENDTPQWRVSRNRSKRAEALLTHLFDTWCARLQEDMTASAHLPHLTLDDLPLRLFRCGYGSSTLDPDFLRHAVGHEEELEVSPASVQVKLLLQHLARMNEELKLFVCLHLDLLLADANEDEVTQALKKYGIADDEILDTVERWRDGFFMNLDEGEKPHEDVVMEVWEGLQRMPLLGAAVPLFMIIKFACMPSRDESITNERLVQLLHRAMSEMIEMVPGVAFDRVDYVVLRAPVELGVAAFKRLTPDQREQFLYTGSYAHDEFEEAYQAYLEALPPSTDTPADPPASTRPRAPAGTP